MSPTAGSIEIDGTDMTRVPPYRRDVGMVFQNYALFPHMTAADNVAFPLRMRRLPRPEIQRRVADALGLVKLADLGNRYPRQLSGGQQQRIALARAVVFEPRLLLMDEPLGALDRKLRESLQLEIIRVSRELGRDGALRDPRPGRGARDERPDRHLQRRADRAAGDGRGPVRPARVAVRGRLHRRIEHPSRPVRSRRRRRRLDGPGRRALAGRAGGRGACRAGLGNGGGTGRAARADAHRRTGRRPATARRISSMRRSTRSCTSGPTPSTTSRSGPASASRSESHASRTAANSSVGTRSGSAGPSTTGCWWPIANGEARRVAARGSIRRDPCSPGRPG